MRGIIRISGADETALLDAMCESAIICATRGVLIARLKYKNLSLPCLRLQYIAPHSYTGEASAELLLPGNPALLDRIVALMFEVARENNLDVRHAEPGEFTARAFLNHRISLIQAEGVAATIAARSDAELRAASMLRDDSLGRLGDSLADELASALALVEAGIDFTDQEDVVAIAADDLRNRLVSLRARIALQLERAVGYGQLESAPLVVLTGAPNAGKSTLFNALLGRTRVIVSPIAGTTRDAIIEPLHIKTNQGDAEVLLVDVAGEDENDLGVMNQQMQSAAQAMRRRADLLLRCVSIDSYPLPGGEGRVRVEGGGGDSKSLQEVIVVTKADASRQIGTYDDANTVITSAVTNRGIAELKQAIATRLADRAVSLAADAVALMPRHETALRDADRALQSSLEFILNNEDRQIRQPELVAASMREALDHLGSLAGRITPDEVLGRIFARFCIGK